MDGSSHRWTGDHPSLDLLIAGQEITRTRRWIRTTLEQEAGNEWIITAGVFFFINKGLYSTVSVCFFLTIYTSFVEW